MTAPVVRSTSRHVRLDPIDFDYVRLCGLLDGDRCEHDHPRPADCDQCRENQ